MLYMVYDKYKATIVNSIIEGGSYMNLESKYENLKNILLNLKSVAVAYSGGVDSTFLLKVAHDILGNNAIAVTAKSYSYPQREFNEAVKYINQIGAKHIVISSEELEIKEFTKSNQQMLLL